MLSKERESLPARLEPPRVAVLLLFLAVLSIRPAFARLGILKSFRTRPSLNGSDLVVAGIAADEVD